MRLLVTMVFAVCSLGAGCGLVVEVPDTRAQMEALSGVTIPADALDVHLESAHGLDWIVRMRFSLPDASVEPFLQAIGLAEPLRDGQDVFSMAPGPWWWRPLSVKGPHAAQIRMEGPHHSTRNVLAAPSNGGRTTLYLVIFS